MKQAIPDIAVVKSMNSARLFRPFYAGHSWDTWRSVLRATFGEAMNPEEIAAFRTVAERDPPKRRVGEAIYVVGRGGGKDSIAALIATCFAMNFDPRGKLRPGEKAVIMCVAVDRDQAGIVHGYIRGLIEEIPALAAMVKSIGNESIELSNRVVIRVCTNSFRSIRGRSIICAIFDEVALWRTDDTSAVPDVEVYSAVRPGLARMPGSMLLLISSTYRRSGLLYDKWKAHYGRDDEDVLVVRGGTLTFNPTYPETEIAKDIASDPLRFRAEYEAEWRDDLSSYIPRDLVEAAVDHGVKVRPPSRDKSYFSFTDVSGGRHDDYAVGIAHREDDILVLDLLFEKKSPLVPQQVTADISALLKSYSVTEIVGDNYGAEWVVAEFAKNGITYNPSELNRSEVYLNMLPAFTGGCVRLIDNPRLVAQFAALERRQFSGGKDKVDHGPGGHDDLCNAAAGALVLAAGESGPLKITAEILRRAALPNFGGDVGFAESLASRIFHRSSGRTPFQRRFDPPSEDRLERMLHARQAEMFRRNKEIEQKLKRDQ
ncbi:MAG: terminase [Alphaproteobacteria bacterium]